MSAVIRAKEVSKWFGEVVAVNNLSVEIEAGVTGLLGPNGAGKSTFIKLALGLYRPSRGVIEVFGEAPCNNRRVLRRIGYCPETDKFYENMSGFEFVYWMNRFWGMGVRDARRVAAAAIDQVRMTDRMHDPISEYSKGMRQRVKIAQALATDPEFLLLDEPMSGLDPEGREEMFQLIRRLGDAGRSVVVSSHVLHEVERATDNVVLLYHGTLIAQGNVREIRDLIDDHPHTITVECRDPRRMSAHFVTDAATIGIEFENGRATLRTRDPNGCYEKLNGLMDDETLGIRSITCADDNLQSVFDYLIH
ncbi:MAG TPA: ABC transporter ATP-binding protein [Candidatus Hydrogenedentes bacterium]|nr:ABC transporter ATP-binding protein [Candidatus Hydrogenedentota bacterium]HNT88189.1 ABC transporter ATP-binding protein [Candidatus Hydrogenedentota bacterium]